jgi:CubicO group peptidase (beta-lactamase class C family)
VRARATDTRLLAFLIVLAGACDDGPRRVTLHETTPGFGTRTGSVPDDEAGVPPEASTSPPTPPAAPFASDDALGESLETTRKKYDVPALAAAVVDGARVRAIAAVGVRKLGDATPAALDDRWHLGSCTKAMTATLAAVLVARGRLRFETTLAEALPELAAELHPRFRKVTLRMLLEHRAGLEHDLPEDLLPALGRPGDPSTLRRVAVNAALKRPPPRTVGAYAYSNAGYMVAGVVLENAGARSWEDLMRAEVFAPLGMASCGFGHPSTPHVVDAPWGHDSRGPVASDSTSFDVSPPFGPAGTVACTLADWGRFAGYHAIAWRVSPPRATSPNTPFTSFGFVPSSFLPPELVRELQTPPAGGEYAMGWQITRRTWAGGVVLQHVGSDGFFTAVVLVAPNRGRAFVAATNRGGANAERAVFEAVTALQHRAREL